MEALEKIEAALDEKVRPYLRSHGGEIAVERFEGGALYVKLLGQCAGCPAADLTAETVVEEELVKALPELVRKVAVTQTVSDELWEQAKRLLREHRL
jgi:Fe-S cluster biogenesis protein NfuA